VTAPALRLRRAPAGLRRLDALRELVLHLASRELRSSHRRSVLGWSWPLLIQLVQLTVLSFVFTRVVPLGIDDYPTFVFCGLVFWSWFRGGLSGAATSVTGHVALVLEPRMPRHVLPLVALAVATFDLLIALPVLLTLVGVTGGVHATWALLPPLLAVQAVMMAGIGLAVAAAHVYVRDVAQIVGVTLLILFYLTPVFYPLDAVPEEYAWIFHLNPIAGFIDAYRSILLDGAVPGAVLVGGLALASIAVFAAGWWTFRRLEPGFVDEL